MTTYVTKNLEKANTLPTSSGCYLMKNKEGKVIYVGKAKNLKSRVTSYFNQSVKNAKTEILVSHIVDFEFLMTANDTEAFVLENNLIKKHAPKYNIRLRDDKTYPYVVIDKEEPFPRLEYVRRPERKKNKIIFGPFVTGSNIWQVMKVIIKSFGLRDCTLREFLSRKEPCLLFQMKQCSAPCVKLIGEEEYDQNLDLALNFFKSPERAQESLKVLEQRMMKAAMQEDFEHAAILRDQLILLKEFVNHAGQKNTELHGEAVNVDVLAYHVGDIEVDISLYMIRNGILLGHKTFHFAVADMMEDVSEEVLVYMLQYYTTTFESLPDLVVADYPEDKLADWQKAMNLSLELKIEVESPKRKYKSLYELTKKHSSESQRIRLSNQESLYVGLNKLKELLELTERPMSLECYDVAIWQGKSPTAALVYFHEGKAEKKRYRHYHLEERPEGNNDFAMMRELFLRRIVHGDFPDVFVIDGGIGQVNTVMAVLKDNNIHVPVVGIAKSKTLGDDESFQDAKVTKSEERLVIPGRVNPYILHKAPALFRIIVQMRDEAHRFSRKLHHKTEEKRIFGDKMKKLRKKSKASAKS
ncbi:MAG: excinuclease ABC subunit UvrC [Bacteriovoracaceae bacterium]